MEALNIAREEFGRRGERESNSIQCCFSFFCSTLLFSGSKSIYRAKHWNIKRLQNLHIFKCFFQSNSASYQIKECCYNKKHFRSQVCDLWSICVRARALICSLDLWRRMLFHGVFFLKAYRWFVFCQIKTLLCLHRKEVKWKLAFLFGLQDVSTHIQAVLEVDRSSKFCCRTNRRWKTDRESRHPNRIVPFHPHIRPSKTGY